MVAGAEVADVGGLEEAGLGAGVALGVAGGGVLARVLDVVVEAQEDGGEKEDSRCEEEVHAGARGWLYRTWIHYQKFRQR